MTCEDCERAELDNANRCSDKNCACQCHDQDDRIWRDQGPCGPVYLIGPTDPGFGAVEVSREEFDAAMGRKRLHAEGEHTS